jgi:transcriptional regulator with XRE-family HTH domain
MTKEEEKLLRLMGKRIRELRIAKGYTSQESFAYDANIPRAQYGRYEAGSNITILSLSKIIQFHKISLEEFFSEGFDSTQEKKKKVTKK